MKQKIGCLIAAAVFAVMLLIIGSAVLPKRYTRFTAERIAALEQEYNISLDSAVPEQWRDMKGAQDITDRFHFTVSDYGDFMTHDFFGQILICSESEDKSNAEYKCRPYDDSRFTFVIHFHQNGSLYDAELTSYYE